jgi:hypothetical protein
MRTPPPHTGATGHVILTHISMLIWPVSAYENSIMDGGMFINMTFHFIEPEESLFSLQRAITWFFLTSVQFTSHLDSPRFMQMSAATHPGVLI